MTRITFYLLPDSDLAAKYRFVCRLAVRALQDGLRVHIRTASREAAATLDEMMWSWPENRFVPHELAETAPAGDGAAPVLIGAAEPSPGADHLLVNLGDDIPAFFSRFERVAEVVTAPERAAGRLRYRHYRERGYPLFHHDLDNWEPT